MASVGAALSISVKLLNEAKADLARLQKDLDGVGDEAKKASPKLNDASDKVTKISKEAGAGHGPLGKFGGALGDVAKIAGGFIIAQGLIKLPGLLMSAGKAAAEDAAATERLNTTLANLAARNGEGVVGLNAMKTAMEGRIIAGQRLAFSDDEVRDSMQFLITATDSFAEASKRSRLAMDLARGANISLEAATKMLGKVNDESVDKFKKLGIELKKNATEADALAAVQARYGGQATAYADSTVGQFARAKIAMAELKETIGGVVMPVFTKLVEVAVPALEKIQANIGPVLKAAIDIVLPPLRKFWDGLKLIGDITVTVAGLVADKLVPAVLAFIQTDIVPKLEAARDAFMAIVPHVIALALAIADKLREPLEAVGKFLKDNKELWGAAAIVIGGVLVAAFVAWAVSAGAAAVATIIAIAPIIAIGLAATALVAGIIWLAKNWDMLTAKYPHLKAASDAVQDAFEAFAGWITGTFVPVVKSIATTIVDAVKKAVDFVSDNWDTIRAVIQPALDFLKVYAETIWDGINIYIKTVLGVIKGVFEVFAGLFTGDWQRMWDGVKAIATAVWEGIKDVINLAIEFIKGMAPLMLAAGLALVMALFAGFKDLDAWMEQKGKDIVTGLWAGIQSLAPWLLSQVFSFGQGIFNAVKAGLGKLNPFSPSKYGIEVGYFLGKGIEVGISQMLPSLLSTVNSMGMVVSTALAAAMRFTVGGVGSGPGGFGTGPGGSQTVGMTADQLLEHLYTQLLGGQIPGSPTNGMSLGAWGALIWDQIQSMGSALNPLDPFGGTLPRATGPDRVGIGQIDRPPLGGPPGAPQPIILQIDGREIAYALANHNARSFA